MLHLNRVHGTRCDARSTACAAIGNYEREERTANTRPETYGILRTTVPTGLTSDVVRSEALVSDNRDVGYGLRSRQGECRFRTDLSALAAEGTLAFAKVELRKPASHIDYSGRTSLDAQPATGARAR